MNKLQEICNAKRKHVVARKAAISNARLETMAASQTAPRGFYSALKSASATGYGLIAEIKKASPSKGLIREDFDPESHAKAYQAGGAACLSVLTDMPYFQGSDDYLIAARQACTLPCLRKDFMVDPWQVLESRALGADAILIIVAALNDSIMAEIEAEAINLGMDVLIEVHDEHEMERAMRLRSALIGINNRDLKTFTTDLKTTENLVKLAANTDRLLVAESGIALHADIVRLSQSGVRSFLVGEALMRQKDVEAATRTLLGTI